MFRIVQNTIQETNAKIQLNMISTNMSLVFALNLLVLQHYGTTNMEAIVSIRNHLINPSSTNMETCPRPQLTRHMTKDPEGIR
jgi:hypothetical protein